jgi:beta-glucanase (GH16 family)
MIYESIGDRIVNRFFQLKSWFRSLSKKNKFGFDEPLTKSMTLDFNDDFKIFDTSKWRIAQPWGRFHKDNPTQYYGDESVYIEENSLILDTRYLPKTGMTTWENDNVYDIDYSVGLISSLKSFGYGFYEFYIELPNGIGLWPAVWLTADDTWPPEIDILEAYSDELSKYDSRLQTNFHFDFNENKKNSGPRNHKISDLFSIIKVSCHWTEDFIKVYYNGYLVRRITSKKTLKWYQNKRMIIVINNALRREYIKYMNNTDITKFKIFGLKYWKYNEK